jgi:tRNA isopentenyl-2-thiomethyl-A-37 hydroxylase MiaE
MDVKDDLAVISTCLAGNNERRRLEDNLRYSLRFSRLNEVMLRRFPDDDEEKPEEAEFDEIPFGPGPPMTHWVPFSDCLKYFLASDFRCDRFYGASALAYLDEYHNAPPPDLPDILDISLCDGGCPMGPGRVPSRNHLNVISHIHAEKKRFAAERTPGIIEARTRFFGESLNLGDLTREYHSSAIIQDYLSEARIADAFLSLKKTTAAQKTIDCYACGAHSCLQMARMVALGVNLPTNCVTLSKELIAQAGKKMADYLQLVRLIGEYTLASGLNDVVFTIEHSLMALCTSLDISRASIWKSFVSEADGSQGCELLINFPARVLFHESRFTSEQLPGWMETLSDGEIIVKSFSELNFREKIFFTGKDLGVLCLVPIMAQGDFWGSVLMVRRHDQPFTREEISVIESSAFLIVSTLISSSQLDGAEALAEPSLEAATEPHQ